MNIDKIILPDFLIADLYKDTLVDIENLPGKQQALAAETVSDETPAKQTLHEKIKYYGENKKKVTIVVNAPAAEFLAKKELTFLSNILNACQLSTADIAVVNTAERQINFTGIKEQLNARQILLFDIEPSVIELPFRIPPFQIQNYAGCAIVLAPSLSTLDNPSAEGRLLKTKLWNTLKQLFEI